MTTAGQRILVASGADRAGVVDDLAQFLHERGAQILESRVSLLHGQFCLLMLIRGDAKALQTIELQLAVFGERSKLHADLRPLGNTEPAEFTPMLLTARVRDAITAVHRLSHLMRVLAVNIEDIQTDTDEAEGASLRMELAVPRVTPLVMLRQYVNALAKEINIKCDLKTP